MKSHPLSKRFLTLLFGATRKISVAIGNIIVAKGTENSFMTVC